MISSIAGQYCGQEGVRTGGMRYHEGVVTQMEPCSGNRVSFLGYNICQELSACRVMQHDVEKLRFKLFTSFSGIPG